MRTYQPIFHIRRFELKYRIPAATADRIIPTLLQYMEWDPYAIKQKNCSYLVKSLYFDSSTFKNYHEKIDGIEKRKKFRLRTYEDQIKDSTKIFWEYKRKHGAVVQKDRIVQNWNLTKRFLLKKATIHDFSEECHPLIREFLMEQKLYNMKPKVIVSYLRKSLVADIKGNHNLRITFDREVRASKNTRLELGNASRQLLPYTVIMEIKCDNMLPFWVHSLIQRYNLTHGAHSKYCYGIEKTYNLPD